MTQKSAKRNKRVGMMKDVPEHERHHLLGKLGRAASPWGKYPHCDTPNAMRSQKKYEREQAIRKAALNKKQEP